MTESAFFSHGVDRQRKKVALMWGNINICPSLLQFHIPSLTPAELSSLNSLRAWGERQKVCHNIIFPLVLTKEEATVDRKYGLSTIWVNPCQSSGPNWPYTLLWLHKGTCHVALPKEGHLGILPQRGGETTSCRQISQLEVCQLLISDLQVAYPIGLNGCEEHIISPYWSHWPMA